MKIYAYEVREDEKTSFEQIGAELNAEITLSSSVPTVETAKAAVGCEGVTILGQGHNDKEILDIWNRLGVKYLATRTIGYNHIDLAYASSLDMQVCNASYGPESVADFTVMLMLMCMRNYKQALWRGQVNDFSLNGLQGRCMKDMTVGIMGTEGSRFAGCEGQNTAETHRLSTAQPTLRRRRGGSSCSHRYAAWQQALSGCHLGGRTSSLFLQ